MNDIFGQELGVGDTVAFNQPGYKNLITGKIIKILPKQIKIAYEQHHRYTSGPKAGFTEITIHETSEYPQNVVKKTEFKPNVTVASNIKAPQLLTETQDLKF